MFPKTVRSKMCPLIFLVVFVIMLVRCEELVGKEELRENQSFVPKKMGEKTIGGLDKFSNVLRNMLSTGRKGGKGGGGGSTSMFFMRTLMDMFNATVPMMVMTVLGWMKDVMMLGAGAFMMMMYDMLSKRGQEKKIIIKLAQAPPEPAPPAQTGYGPWEGK